MNFLTKADLVRRILKWRLTWDKRDTHYAHTVPGKGVSYMEGNYLWHSQPFKPGQAEAALAELDATGKKLKEELAALV